ncbi:MAG: 2-succinyl-5-enolpyruvyl-6-hydroxy-3-cyclohexene-1-carboxylic-acid synthase [Deltaproteobacteria bacterium]|nr:2-succinyl-5-enolpyruvyl-6-hydroxy-3-cyclohexene-1-carboxylic-acid synthase [Deltaproteobacteria bacterium]
MAMSKENMNLLWASLLIEELIRTGVTYFCISPGSRSTPLTTAVARNRMAQSLICYDERGAAFHALGYGRATGRPAALICTSGTALANYLPAVVEASMDQIPMLVISADRPPELRDTGANQTIRQPKMFGEYVRWDFDLPCPDPEIPPQMILTTIDQAVSQAIRKPAGPVHLNCMWREPLAPIPAHVPDNYLTSLGRWPVGGGPYTRYTPAVMQPDQEELDRLAALINTASSGLLVVGRLASPLEIPAVARLAAKLRWPVLADIGSGLRLGFEGGPPVPYFDQLWLSQSFREGWRPQVILHLGGQVTSKRFQQYLEASRPDTYVVVKDHPGRHDPGHLVTWRLEAEYGHLCRALTLLVQPSANLAWLEDLMARSNRVDQVLEDYSAQEPDLTEPVVARLISKNLPGHSALFLGSSMPVRDMDMFAQAGRVAVPVGANRGASGIDGTMATAAGFAVGLNRPVTLVIGDLAFLHDLNSLAQVKMTSPPVIIVLINNQGGGIFSFLPIAQYDDVFEAFFATPHALAFKPAADLFGLDYYAPTTRDDFLNCFLAAHNKGTSAVIEIRTDRKENFALHQRLSREITAALAAA